jgi:hypothetical protein
MWRDYLPPHVSEYLIIRSSCELYRYFKIVAKEIYDKEGIIVIKK